MSCHARWPGASRSSRATLMPGQEQYLALECSGEVAMCRPDVDGVFRPSRRQSAQATRWVADAAREVAVAHAWVGVRTVTATAGHNPCSGTRRQAPKLHDSRQTGAKFSAETSDALQTPPVGRVAPEVTPSGRIGSGPLCWFARAGVLVLQVVAV